MRKSDQTPFADLLLKHPEETVNEEKISEAHARERTKVNGGHKVLEILERPQSAVKTKRIQPSSRKSDIGTTSTMHLKRPPSDTRFVAAYVSHKARNPRKNKVAQK